MNLRIVLDTFRQQGIAVDELVVIGGGAKSKTWRQILSDVYNIEIQKPNYLEEATSMGAAITAGVGVGVFDSFDVIDKFLEIEQTHHPVAENVPFYEHLTGIFNKAYFALEGIFGELSQYKK